MTRTKLDLAAGVLVASVLVVGVLVTLQSYQQATGGMHASMHGPHPAWNLLGSLLVAGVLAGVYVLVRDQLHRSASAPPSGAPVEDVDDRSTVATDDTDAPPPDSRDDSGGRVPSELLAYLPEDERRVLEPVVDSPGITQIALRDRSEFSKSKVSQTVSDLEKRGLLYRESQGRTYRVYPADDLRTSTDE